MSLITDLLSKVKQQEPKRDVPPLLKDSVQHATVERQARNKYTIPVVVVMAIVVTGVGAMFLMDFFDKPAKSLPPRQPVAATSLQPREPALVPSPPRAAEKVAMPATIKEEPEKIEGAPPHHKKTSLKRLARKPAPKSAGDWKEMKQERASGVNSEEQVDENEKISKQDKDVYLYTARTYELQKNYQKALSDYRKVLTVDPRNFMVMNNISSALIQLGSYDEAVRYAEKALHIRKDYIYSLINMGVAYSHLGKYKEGESYLQRALLMEPSNRNALLNIGLLYEKSKSYDKAREFFIRLSDTGDAQGYIGLARIAEKQGRTAEAVNYYRAAMSLEVSNSPIWNLANDRLWQLTK
ncbi:MAG: tetratricopeptide repeat protein [Deltaproteobacteria bacterium]|nr:tetratricopeptide repeat protein [Deltaproteobacteria bacterium]